MLYTNPATLQLDLHPQAGPRHMETYARNALGIAMPLWCVVISMTCPAVILALYVGRHDVVHSWTLPVWLLAQSSTSDPHWRWSGIGPDYKTRAHEATEAGQCSFEQ